jgi:hypothetical protein
MLVVDDMSRYMWAVLLANKSDAEDAFRKLCAGVENEAGRKIKAFRTDRGGGEFTSNSFLEFCSERGIKRHLTAPYSPQQNGVVERRNQSVLAMARSMMKAKAVPARLWGEAVMTAVFLLNRASTRSLVGRTPYEAWHGERPAVHFLRVFDCVAHVKITKPNAGKLDDRSTKMVMIGYEAGSKAYRVYDPVANRVHVTRDVVFEEGATWGWNSSDNRDQEGSCNDGDQDTFVVEEWEETTAASPTSHASPLYTRDGGVSSSPSGSTFLVPTPVPESQGSSSASQSVETSSTSSTSTSSTRGYSDRLIACLHQDK